jgi:Carboxypeptidase regulatory-like domain
MASATATARCPSCGTELRAAVGSTAATQWFPCPNCHQPVPFVPPRELPPLFSWEVVPGLYPQLAAPRPVRWHLARAAAVALAIAATFAAAAAGVLAYEGYVAAQPAEYTVSGVVYEPSGNLLVPLSGATVSLSSNGGPAISRITGPNGVFVFDRVPSGGIELNVSAAGFGPEVVYAFASPSYSTQTQGLGVVLSPGPSGNETVTALTPFGDLETLLAYVGGATVLLAGAAIASGAGAIALRRPEGAVLGVIGAGAAIAVPVLLLLLSVTVAYPDAGYVGGVAGGAGGFALALATVMLASRSLPREPGTVTG